MGDLFIKTAGPAEILAVFAAGLFFLVALLCGVWKWRQMLSRPDHLAHPYVDIAHRASLLYSFAALLLAVFAGLSAWSATIDLVATAVPLAYFAGAIAVYIWHGAKEDTSNQFESRGFLTTWGTVLLVIGEIGGFLVLFAGTVKTLTS
jgi:ABC-type multidrug transport system permease subunit